MPNLDHYARAVAVENAGARGGRVESWESSWVSKRGEEVCVGVCWLAGALTVCVQANAWTLPVDGADHWAAFLLLLVLEP